MTDQEGHLKRAGSRPCYTSAGSRPCYTSAVHVACMALPEVRAALQPPVSQVTLEKLNVGD